MTKSKEELRNELIEEIRNMPDRYYAGEGIIDTITFIKFNSAERYKRTIIEVGDTIDYGFVSYNNDRDILSLKDVIFLSKDEMIEKIKNDAEKNRFIKIIYSMIKNYKEAIINEYLREK